MTFYEMCDKYLEKFSRPGLSTKTLEGRLAQLKTFVGDIPLEGMGQLEWLYIQMQLETMMSAVQTAHLKMLLTSMFVEEGMETFAWPKIARLPLVIADLEDDARVRELKERADREWRERVAKDVQSEDDDKWLEGLTAKAWEDGRPKRKGGRDAQESV